MKKFMVLIMVLICSVSFAETMVGIGSPYGITPTGTDTVFINSSACQFWKANSAKQGDFTKVIGEPMMVCKSVVASSTTQALPKDCGLVSLTAGSASDVATLADGHEGQMLVIVLEVCASGAKVVLTPENLLAGTTITFDAVEESVILVFHNGKWIMVSGSATKA